MKSHGKASGGPASAKVDGGEGHGSGSTTIASVERDAAGRIVKGAANPGGMTKEQRQARDALNKWLCEEPQLQAGKDAYMRCLAADNPVIVKDFMDRVAGKVKDVVEHQGNAAPMRLTMLTREEILAIAKGETP